MPTKHENTERWGGPGASHENAERPVTETRAVKPSDARNRERKSFISGGGGERDLHHSHDPKHKS